MDLRQLRAVVAVVDEGGFTRAAELLDVAQPSLSQSIARLERELGVLLFDRVGRGVVLTSAGAALLEPARQALRAAETARAAAAAVLGLAAGRLDVAALPTLAIDPAADVIGAFRGEAPGVTVRLYAPEDPESLLALVRTGECELGFTEAGLPIGGELVVRELAAQEFLAVLPPGAAGAFAARASLSIRDLAEMAFVTTPARTSTRRLVDAAFAGAGRSLAVAVETSHRDVIVPLVLAGAGVSLLPKHLADDAVARGATALPVDPPVTRRVALVSRRGQLSPAAQAFVELAVERLPS
jgi:DNA-binding transcriptional LysR family regulator